MSKEKIQVGMIGMGSIAGNRHVAAFRAHADQVAIRASATPIPARCNAAEQTFPRRPPTATPIPCWKTRPSTPCSWRCPITCTWRRAGRQRRRASTSCWRSRSRAPPPRRTRGLTTNRQLAHFPSGARTCACRADLLRVEHAADEGLARIGGESATWKTLRCTGIDRRPAR